MEIINTSKKNRESNWFNILIGVPFFIILILLILLPMSLLIVYSFAHIEGIGFGFTLTFQNYIKVFENITILSSLRKSLVVALITTLITLMIGYPLAYLISRQKPQTQKILILLVNAPMWINILLKVLAIKQLLLMFDPSFMGSDFGTVFGMVYVYLPFMVLPIYAILSKLDKSFFEGAADLGASKFETITRVIIPLSLGGVLSGIAMVFLPAATTMVIGKYLGSSDLLIGDVIESAIKKRQFGGYGFGAAMSVMIALVMMLMIYIFRRMDKYEKVLDER